MDAVSRARVLLAAGDSRAALAALQPFLKDAGLPDEARLALSETYRAMGCPDQAGRWGIAFDGWSSDFEIDRLARLLAATGVTRESAADFLALSSDRAGSASLDAVYERVDVYVSRFRARMWERMPGRPTSGTRLRTSADGLVVAAITLGIASLLSVSVITLADGVGARPTALIVNGLSAVMLGAALTLYGVSRCVQHRWRSGLLMNLGGVVAIGLTAVVEMTLLPDSWG